MGYAILTATLAYAFVTPVASDLVERRRRLALSVGLAIVFGICMELVQWPIPHRTASEIDAIANTIGAFLMGAVWWGLNGTIQFGESNSVSN